MFRRVIVDISDLEDNHKALRSSIYILVDDHVDGHFEIRRWASQPGEGAGKRSAAALLRPRNPDKPLSLSKGDDLAFADYYIYEPGWGWSLSDYERVRENDIVFSTQSWVRKAVIAAQGLTPQTSILILASAGIEFIMPNVIIENPYSHELSRAKERLKEERRGYLKALAKVGEEAFERLSSGDYGGIAAWARNASLSTLKPKAEHLKKKLEKQDRRLLKGIGFDSFDVGLPVLGKEFFDYGENTDEEDIEDFLSLLCPSLKKNLEERRVPEANFGITLSDDFDI